MNERMAMTPHGWAIAAVLMAASFGIANAASNETPNSTPQNVFDGMRESFRSDKAAGVHIKYQWELSGADGGEWFVEVKDGKCRIEKGRIDHPDVTIIVSDKDWVAISNGKLNGTWAYLTRRLKIQGTRDKAQKLSELFP